MEEEIYIAESEKIFPVLVIPKECTSFETSPEDDADNLIMVVNISSPDDEGNETRIYSGLCNVKFIDGNDVDVSEIDLSGSTDSNENPIPIIVNDANQLYAPYTQSQVWIDPARSPYVYNRCDAAGSQEHYSIHQQSHSGCITVEQQNTYITRNVYNYKEAIKFSPIEKFEHKKLRKISANDASQMTETTLYETDEFERGVFLSQLAEEVMQENVNGNGEELKDFVLQRENDALKQLMSPDILALPKQQKTILFSGHNSHYGQTIQKIRVNDPSLKCVEKEVENEVTVETNSTNQKKYKKKYQCDKCKQLFDQITAFKQHMVGSHKSKIMKLENDSICKMKFNCTDCGKILKNKKKFEAHCLGHGDPDLECDNCHKVFASKFTLRNHQKIHKSKNQCSFCSKSFCHVRELRNHVETMHFGLTCEECDFSVCNDSEMKAHKLTHKEIELKQTGEDSFTLSLNEDYTVSNSRMLKTYEDQTKLDEIKRADSVIAKVMANEIFMSHTRKSYKRFKKSCEVCFKSFYRVGDLKRHLIEHIVRSTLAKTPVSKNGSLTIQCEICKSGEFSKIDKFKAHLREHAKLTLYKCTFCDKSFSDSSNFSKHKKIHGTTFFQCDLCQRKFNSKKMITHHMEYHNNNSPISCLYCDKEFHFRSTLNKHIKCAHSKEIAKFRCKFCQEYFKFLKEKWDHEWLVHKVRKMIVDCLICESKFRKYSELKKHCVLAHNLVIPPAKKLLKKRK